MLFYLQISVALPFSWRICSVYVVYNPEPSKPQTIANVRDWNRPKLLEASDLFWHAFEMGGSTWWQIIYIYIYWSMLYDVSKDLPVKKKPLAIVISP